MRAISARRRTSTRRPAAGWTWSGAASSWPRTGPSGVGAPGSFGAAFSRHIERAATPRSRTRSRSPSPPSRGRSGWSSTWALVVLALVVLLERRGRAPRGRPRPRPASWRCSSTASAMRASPSTPPPGRCWAWVSRCGAYTSSPGGGLCRRRQPRCSRSQTATRRRPAAGSSVRGRLVFEYLRRLATTGAAYTASSVLSKLIAVFLLPIYTHYLTPERLRRGAR